MIGSSRIGVRAARAVAQRHRAGQLEGHRRAVDVVVAAVDERDLDVDQREAGQDAAVARLADALLDRRDELLGDDAADDLVVEDDALAALVGLDAQLDVAVLAVAAGLLDVLVVLDDRLR